MVFLSSYVFTSGQFKGLLAGSVVKNSPAKQEMHIQSLGQEDSLEKEMVIHSRILPWEIPCQRSLEVYSP